MTMKKSQVSVTSQISSKCLQSAHISGAAPKLLRTQQKSTGVRCSATKSSGKKMRESESDVATSISGHVCHVSKSNERRARWWQKRCLARQAAAAKARQRITLEENLAL